uniref:Uncharacterized protein n=1 Tax=Rhizophora mucronata TaxID=61149 RepID=A0A2P2J067_RHIMU
MYEALALDLANGHCFFILSCGVFFEGLMYF